MAMRARDMRGSALAAALFMATACGCAIWVFMESEAYSDPQRVRPLLAASAAGLYAGWFHLSRKLGNGVLNAGLFGLGAGFVAFLIFAVMAAARASYQFHQKLLFDSAQEALYFFLNAIVGVVVDASSQNDAVLTLMGMSLAAGVFSEALNRLWR